MGTIARVILAASCCTSLAIAQPPIDAAPEPPSSLVPEEAAGAFGSPGAEPVVEMPLAPIPLLRLAG